jgi:FimV-like protein
MTTQRLAIGELDVLIMGKVLPIRKAPRNEQRAIAETLIERLRERITPRFPFQVEFSIDSIYDGCIRVKFDLAITQSDDWDTAVATVANYPDFKHNVRALWDDSCDIVEFMAEGRACTARYAGSQMTDRLYGPVPDEASLMQIASKLDLGGNTREQAMIAIFEANRDCFIDDNVNRLKSGSLLVMPDTSSIAGISSQRANMQIIKHMRRFKARKE